jgi:hypothetical protein
MGAVGAVSLILILFFLGVVSMRGGRVAAKIRREVAGTSTTVLDLSVRIRELERAVAEPSARIGELEHTLREIAFLSPDDGSESDSSGLDEAAGGETNPESVRAVDEDLLDSLAAVATSTPRRKYVLVRIRGPRRLESTMISKPDVGDDTAIDMGTTSGSVEE